MDFDIKNWADSLSVLLSIITLSTLYWSWKMGSRSLNWCFTLNNYTAADIERLLLLPVGDGSTCVQYLVFGREVGANGTPHLQGFVRFAVRKRRTAVIALIGQAHLTITRSVPAAIEYCKKDGDFEEIGTFDPESSSVGKRTDLEAFKEDVRNGLVDMRSVRDLHSETYAKYPRFCLEFISDHAPRRDIENHDLRPWQSALLIALRAEPDDRKVIFVIDSEGNTGKSWFCDWYCQYEGNAQILQPSKKADMAHCFDQGVRVVFIDAPRSKQGDFIQYDFLEDLKNGRVFATKYESRMKYCPKLHVVVMMNEQPDMTKLSDDRYDIRDLNEFN